MGMCTAKPTMKQKKISTTTCPHLQHKRVHLYCIEGASANVPGFDRVEQIDGDVYCKADDEADNNLNDDLSTSPVKSFHCVYLHHRCA